MAASVLTVNTVETETPATLTFQDTHNSDGAVFKNSGKEFLALKNNGADTAQATIVAQVEDLELQDIGKVTKADIVVSLAAGAIKIVGPIPRKVFNDENGNVVVEVGGTGAADIQAYVFRSSVLRA